MQNSRVRGTDSTPMMMGRKRPMEVGMKEARTLAMWFMMPLCSSTPRNTPAARMVDAIIRPAEEWDLMILFCILAPG